MPDQSSQPVSDEELRKQINRLDDGQRKAFYTELEQQLKDPDTYAVLNYLFICGLHHFYLGNLLRGGINLAGFLLSIGLLFSGQLIAGTILLLAITALELRELFRAQQIVANHNRELQRQLLARIHQPREIQP